MGGDGIFGCTIYNLHAATVHRIILFANRFLVHPPLHNLCQQDTRLVSTTSSSVPSMIIASSPTCVGTEQTSLLGNQPPRRHPSCGGARVTTTGTRGTTLASLHAVLAAAVLLPDDRDPCKMWCVKSGDMVNYLYGSLCADSGTWRRRPDLTVAQVVAYLWAVPFLGLPAWLRLRWNATCWAPSILPLVMSKCFSVRWYPYLYEDTLLLASGG